MKDPRDIILKPVVSEKSYELRCPTSTQPLSLLERERISIHDSPGEPVETLLAVAGLPVGVQVALSLSETAGLQTGAVGVQLVPAAASQVKYRYRSSSGAAVQEVE